MNDALAQYHHVMTTPAVQLSRLVEVACFLALLIGTFIWQARERQKRARAEIAWRNQGGEAQRWPERRIVVRPARAFIGTQEWSR